MSQINLKSITGITSITTPAGVDDVFTVHSNDTTERFRVDSNGNQVIAGILTVSQDLDVDGHTNLDNVSIAGVTTFSGGLTATGIDLNGDIDVDGHTNLDNVNIAGVTTSSHLTINGDLTINDNYPSIYLNDTDSDSDFMLQNQNGVFTVYDATNNADRFEILSNGTVRSPHYTLQSQSPSITFNDTNHDSDFMIQNANGLLKIYDNTNGADRFGVNSSGSVYVYGNELYIGDSIIHNGDANTKIRFPSNDTISFETASYERFRITSDGRFGFNTTNPDSNFRMDLAGSLRVGTGSYGSRIQFSRSGLGDELVIGVDGYGNSTTNEATIQSSINSPRPLVFATNNTERLRITSDGDLLIGRTSSGAHSNGNELQIGSGSGTSGLTIFSATTDAGSIYYADGTSGDARYRGFLEYYHAADSLAIGIAGDEKFRFALNGTNGDLRFDIATGGQAQIAALSGNGNAYNLGSSGGAAIRFMDTSGSHTIEFDTHWTGYHHSTSLKLGRTGSLITRDFRDASIGRDYTSGSVANGTSVNWNGSGADAANSKLNANSIGGNGGGHITCLSVSSQDGNPSGAQIITGVHGQGFNTYVTHASNFDSGISVTFNGTWTIANSSGETIYYRVNVIHMGTSTTTYHGR